MPLLIIQEDDGTEVLRVKIERVTPSVATVAIIEALGKIPNAKKRRSDAGNPRSPKPTTPQLTQP